MKERQLALLGWSEKEKSESCVKITKSPEENEGILVTESSFYILSWVDTLKGVCSAGKLVNKTRLYSQECLRVPDEEYNKHRQLAESAFEDRRVARRKKEKALQGTARLFI